MNNKRSEDIRGDFRKKRIGVLMGGMSSERKISLRTGEAVINALHERGYSAVPVDVNSNTAGSLQKNNIDVAFIALHGTLGEDGTIQGLLEISGIPYTGSSVLASALAMNKAASKKIFSYHGLPTPAFQSFHVNEDEVSQLQNQITIPLPFIIKPSEEGSTIGISIIEKQEHVTEGIKKALQNNGEIIIEEFIHGRELTVGILNGQPLPLIEIRPKSGFYDYRSKYMSGETEYIISPDVDRKKTDSIQNLAVQAFNALGCSGVARVDFILSSRGVNPYILEINTIPGMTETSLLPMAAKRAGIDFNSLVENILCGATNYKIKYGKDCKNR